MLRRRSLTCIALFALLGGCTGGSPSEADARKEFENKSKWSYKIEKGKIKIIKGGGGRKKENPAEQNDFVGSAANAA